MKFINQMEPWFDDNEIRAIVDYMRGGGWVTEFKRTREFEAMIAEYTGSRFCSVVSNGTLSLTLGLIACGVGPGDEVIVPDYTMVATPNAVKLAGANVVFVDICPQTLCMDYERMCSAVSSRTRAILLVTINGRYPRYTEDFVTFCREHGLVLMEDAAQSFGSRRKGQHLGTFGDVGSFSFSAPKIITTGQGGALVTDSEILIDRIRKLRDFGRSSGGIDHYLTMGWNFKFTDIQAVIGIEQMKKLDWRVARKKAIYRRYRDSLEGVDGISFIPTDLQDTSPWFVDILVHNGLREELIEYLREKGIGSRPFYPALHSEPVYNIAGFFPVTERISQEGLWLPSSANLEDTEVDYICMQTADFMSSK